MTVALMVLDFAYSTVTDSPKTGAIDLLICKHCTVHTHSFRNLNKAYPKMELWSKLMYLIAPQVVRTADIRAFMDYTYFHHCISYPVHGGEVPFTIYTADWNSEGSQLAYSWVQDPKLLIC